MNIVDSTVAPPSAPLPSNGAYAGRKFVWLLAPPWEGVWTRQNHFALGLARQGAEVLYVENPGAWTSALQQRRWRDLPFGAATRLVAPGVHVLRSGFNLPGSARSDAVARFNGARVGARVARWLRERNWRDYTCWCRLPHSVFALEALRPAATVYDITDDYELFESHPRARALVRAREARLLRRTDRVFVTTPELQRKHAGVPTQCVPNGVDYDLFATTTEPGEIHPLVESLTPPVIGCVGLVSPWTDFALLRELGRHWPNQVLMIGPVDARVEEQARAIPGLVWAGFVPQRELPDYLRGIALGLMPYLVNERTMKASPLRLWEYLAAGKPVVSVDIPAARAAAPYVDIARDRDHFVRLVAQRLRCGTPWPHCDAQPAARAWSWDSLLEKALLHLPAEAVPRSRLAA